MSLLVLLRLGRRWTAGELAARLEVSVRTIHRDIQALVDAGLPIRADRGPAGGFVLDRGYRLGVPWTLEEAQALLLGAPGAASALGLRAILAEAQLKLLASLPGEVRSAAMRTSQIFHIDETRWFRSAEVPHLLAELSDAATEQVRVQVRYWRKGKLNDETLEPLGFVSKAGVWYLVARKAARLRTYRVSRIASAVVSTEHFERPTDFDLLAYWEHAREEFEQSRPRIEVVLRVKAVDIPSLRAAVDWSVRPAIDGLSRETSDGWLELKLPFERVEYAYDDLVKLGGKVEIIDPPELRERLARTGQELVGRYGTAR
jgi:predicted DNA-binding transcriptional regulator YafY